MTMKKIISVLAMALLVIGAAQAQNQVRNMVIRQNDGQALRFNTANIEEVTFEEVAVPTTVEGAEAMLVGYWRACFDFGSMYDYDIEGLYMVITEDLTVYSVYKIANTVSDEDYAEYAGKYLATDDDIVIVNSEDPTMATFSHWATFIKNLQENSFIEVDEDDESIYFLYERVEPFEYIIPDYGLMKKGLMKNGLMKK